MNTPTNNQIQQQRNAEHVMLGRLANKAREQGRLQLAATYERGMEMIARLYRSDAQSESEGQS